MIKVGLDFISIHGYGNGLRSFVDDIVCELYKSYDTSFFKFVIFTNNSDMQYYKSLLKNFEIVGVPILITKILHHSPMCARNVFSSMLFKAHNIDADIVCISDFVKNDICGLFSNVKQGKISVIPNSVGEVDTCWI